MVREFNIDKEIEKNELINILQKTVQSANLNYIIGSGCSIPALKALGNIEDDIQKLINKDEHIKANKKLVEFLKPFINSTKKLKSNVLDKDHKKTLKYYEDFIETISNILYERKSNLLHKQANVFTTNYDLFIEMASESYTGSLILNDGFQRTSSLNSKYDFSTNSFFNSVSNTGNLYKYQVQIPTINLIKIHGSINWKVYKDQNKISKIQQSLSLITRAKKLVESKKDDDLDKLLKLFAIIMPKKDKFQETVINQTYYDLLRIYSNELDKENTLLIAEGFSFADEHILDLTSRALKNPTLRLIIFCFNKNDLKEQRKHFSRHNNVNLVYSEDNNIDFNEFNTIFTDILPKKEEVPIYKVELKDSNNG